MSMTERISCPSEKLQQKAAFARTTLCFNNIMNSAVFKYSGIASHRMLIFRLQLRGGYESYVPGKMAASLRVLDADETKDVEKKDICVICVKCEALYTCPRCNVRYCSLSCYRHEKHQGCSEAFYKDCVIEEIQGLSAKPQDRQKILEMLAREQQETRLDSDDDDEDSEDLSVRLYGLDFDSDSQEIWERLTEKEREEFACMLKDGRLANLVDTWTPWWMTQQPEKLVDENVSRESYLPKGYPQHLKDVPDINQLLKSSKPSADVKFNVINVLSAYVFIARLHNGSHHGYPVDSAEELLSVSTVLRENQSLNGAQEAIQSVVQDIQKAGAAFCVHPSYPLVLLEDVLCLLSARCSSPVLAVISALSDTCAILKKANQELKKSKSRNSSQSTYNSEKEVQRQIFCAKKKMVFFISWAQRYGMCLSSLVVELSLALECRKAEMEQTCQLESEVDKQRKAGKLKPLSAKADIQEVA